MSELHQFSFRLPSRSRALMLGIRKATGMTFTQIIIQAIECLAEKYGIALERNDQ